MKTVDEGLEKRCRVAQKGRLGGEKGSFKAPDQPLADAYRRLPPLPAAYFSMCFFPGSLRTATIWAGAWKLHATFRGYFIFLCVFAHSHHGDGLAKDSPRRRGWSVSERQTRLLLTRLKTGAGLMRLETNQNSLSVLDPTHSPYSFNFVSDLGNGNVLLSKWKTWLKKNK